MTDLLMFVAFPLLYYAGGFLAGAAWAWGKP